jgi:hypothetical protein
VQHLDVVHVHGELVGRDLRQRGRVALAAAAGAGEHDDLPGRLDPDRARLVRAQAGLLHEAAEAHPDAAALGPGPLALGREVGVAGELGGALQAGGVVAGVVDDRAREDVAELAVQRPLVGRDHVAQPHRHRVKPEVGGHEIDDPLHGERRLHVADAAERVHRRLVVTATCAVASKCSTL